MATLLWRFFKICLELRTLMTRSRNRQGHLNIMLRTMSLQFLQTQKTQLSNTLMPMNLEKKVHHPRAPVLMKKTCKDYKSLDWHKRLTIVLYDGPLTMVFYSMYWHQLEFTETWSLAFTRSKQPLLTNILQRKRSSCNVLEMFQQEALTNLAL
jgi:hypothetical protein